MRPIAIDLCSGLGGWAEGLEEEGFDVIRVDIEDMFASTGTPKPPGCLLMLQDILTFHGSQAKHAALIVASPPCQEYSYMAMPWKRAKAKGAAIKADETGAETERLNRLFNACFRIQREASEAAGRHVPLVLENVRGARPWVGPSAANYGSYYLWGDVPLPLPEGKPIKVRGFRFDGEGGSFQTAAVQEGRKHHGDWFRDPSRPSRQGGQIKQRWFNDGPRTPESLASSSSNSPARKLASAKIAKIPLTLSRHVGRHYFEQWVLG